MCNDCSHKKKLGYLFAIVVSSIAYYYMFS